MADNSYNGLIVENPETVNFITLSDDTQEIVRTILKAHGKEATARFIKNLSGFNDNQVEGFITLMTI
jgi:hypothetical protein